MNTRNKATKRSYEKIKDKDLQRLAKLAREDLGDLFRRKPDKSGRYKGRPVMLCLCQGAAEHFVYGKRGVKDFDVWAFFSKSPKLPPFPYRRRGKVDFGPSRFGRHSEDKNFEGRRVDVLGRSIECSGKSLEKCVLEWLEGGKTKSAKEIAKRPVVVIYPERLRGIVIWPPRAKTIRRGRA